MSEQLTLVFEKTLQGHSKLSNQLLHLVTSHVNVAALLTAAAIMIHPLVRLVSDDADAPALLLQALLFVFFVSRYSASVSAMTSSPSLSKPALFARGFLMSCIAALTVSVIVHAAMFPLCSSLLGASPAGGFAVSVGVFVLSGLLELASHRITGEQNQGAVVTQGKAGVQKVLAVLFDVVLVGPLAFLELTCARFM